jgi:hypothetical protein
MIRKLVEPTEDEQEKRKLLEQTVNAVTTKDILKR